MISTDVQEFVPVATFQFCKSSPFIEEKKGLRTGKTKLKKQHITHIPH